MNSTEARACCFDPKHNATSLKPRTMHSPGRIFLEDVHTATFGAGFVALTQAEFTAMNPQQKQLLKTAFET